MQRRIPSVWAPAMGPSDPAQDGNAQDAKKYPYDPIDGQALLSKGRHHQQQ